MDRIRRRAGDLQPRWLRPLRAARETLASRGVGKVAGETYTTSQRWDKILRAKLTSDAGGSPTLVTCWVGADGRASIVVKIDDGEP